ncbi:DUF6095 family protein [Flavobacterium sp.]|uniref:DUF6095 family protein n=1 Tax=Flavobacterium sp. TaxID=239 RepID=UPI003B9CE24B
MAVNKEILYKGIGKLLWSLPCLFVGPTVIHFSFKNQQQPLFPVILAVGCIICVVGMFLIFKGVMTIVKSLD